MWSPMSRCVGWRIVQFSPSDTDVRVAAWVVDPAGAERLLGLASHSMAQTGAGGGAGTSAPDLRTGLAAVLSRVVESLV